MEYLIVIALVCGVAAAAIWANKGGDATAGFLLGALLGIIGLILVAAMTPTGFRDKRAGDVKQRTRQCPHCREPMHRDASVCPHCQRDSEPWTFHDGYWWVTRQDGRWWFHESMNEWVKWEEGDPVAPA